ncbi:CAMK family protein kinase [Tritrichomonas foetus]|uniref:non-specific serine/threonine protein kinase n=1 Tax=Tritrichomonas foetus TaxID=1144522 RepID=A0A1J4JN79_9EUKA|nr:CAMK family protein kinase [Tritrichomonas foetus]|eukprot:OHT00583.1 CAMK family protein kinase [Tritrichomonas foetus]
MGGPRPGSEIEDYVFERRVGESAFATVWRAHHKLTGSPVAIKIMKKESIDNAQAHTRLMREIALLKRMHHPFISQFYQLMQDEFNFYMVMEYVENGNLLDYVNNNGRLNEEQARKYFCQLISALEYLHKEQKVAHRDLKCENILLDKYNNIRLIDFGLSNVFTDIQPELKTACGSPAYAAPEMIKGNAYTIAADIWSSGILLFAIVSGQLPFDDDNIQRLLQKIVYTEAHYPSYFSPQLADILSKMLCKSPDQRITLDMIKNHPWFSQTEYNNLNNLEVLKNLDVNKSFDYEIIDQITQLGLDISQLHASLLSGDFTELTGLYMILEREKITEKMKDIMKQISATTPIGVYKNPMRPIYIRPPTAQPAEKNPSKIAFPGQQKQQPGTQIQRVLPMPVPQTGSRRYSRPVAFRRRNLNGIDLSNPGSLEM